MQESQSDNKVDELHQHHKFIADQGQEPLRVDKFIMNFVENATRNKVQKAAKNGNIFVNNIAVKSNHKVKPKDEVKVMLEH
jgi:23S rRNA pseudouridine1911/1915/1917 synthase